MNRKELIEATAKAANITKKQAEDAIGNALGIIEHALMKGDAVALLGFGTFKAVKTAARTGRNPRTGAEIQIKARFSPKFTPGKALKDALN